MKYGIIGLLLFGFLAPSAPLRADEVYHFVVKKQEEKQNRGWSLSEWLETRDRMRLMDLWLALHSPSPYEFYLSGAYQVGQSSFSPNYTGLNLAAAGYASIFGLQAERESYLDKIRYSGILDFRIFGFYVQGTNITLQAGVRGQAVDNSGVGFRSALAGVSTSFYFTRYFGIDGLYRHYFDSTGSTAGVTVGGNRYEGGAFLDFKFLRIFGTYFSEPETQTAAGTSVDTTRSGYLLGSTLFF